MREERIGDARLFLGDCREVLPGLSGVNAVITDPPFNAGRSFANDDMHEEEWRLFCSSLACMLKFLDPENVLIEVGKNDKEMRAAFDATFNYKWAISLNYTNAMRNGAVGYSNFGLVLWYGGKCHQRYMDRIDAPLTSTISEFRHPSPKEITHYQRLVSMFTKSHSIVLDPFMGSGTTGVACARLGRQFIGCEIDERYFDTACRRIEQAQRQADLFVPRAITPKATQPAML